MDEWDNISFLLASANQSILDQRAGDALPALRAAYPLLTVRVAAKTSFSAIITIQAGLMSILAEDEILARKYIELLIDEVGQELERLGKLFAEQVKAKDRQAARQTQVRAYTYSVSFVPFVKGARLANLLQGETAPSTSPEVDAIGRIQEQVRPRLDALGWGSWDYPPVFEKRARYWAADALVRWAHAIMDNRDSGVDVRMAQELAESTQDLIQGFPEDQLRADLWNLSARIYTSYGESHYEDGVNAMMEAIRICEEIGNEADAARNYAGVAAIEIEQADFLACNGKPEEADQKRNSAEQHLIQARNTLMGLNENEDFILASVNLVALYSKQGRWQEAENVFQEAWQRVPHTGDQRVYISPRISGNYGSSLFDQGRSEEAENWLRVALEDVDAIRTRDPEVYQVVHGTLGRLLSTTGRAEEGYRSLSLAVRHLETYRTTFIAERSNSELLKTYRWVYEALIDCCATLGERHPERRKEAFEWAELTKWRSLTILLRYLPLGLLDERREPRVKEESELLLRAMTALGKPADSALDTPEILARLEKIWSDMAAEHPHYVAFRRQQTTTVAETKALLDEQVPCLLEYFLGDQYGTSLAFVVNRNEEFPHAIRLPVATDIIAEQVQQLRAIDDTQPERLYREISRKLHDVLIAPVRAYLPDEAGICVVPYGPLHNLPFAGLYDGQSYLIERNSLVVAPSASALRWWVEKNTQRKDSCLIFTATSKVFSGNERQDDLVLFESLANKRIRPLFGTSKLSTGPAATKANLLAEFRSPQEWPVFHIACHGEFGKDARAGNGLTARLITAGEPGLGKDLTAHEICEHVRTSASLVTLSACESAIAEATTNDEVMGLAHAFLLAGAASVLATLTYVRQDPGVAVSEKFYRSWMGQSGGHALSKIQALRRAQLDALQQRDLFGWGGLTWHPHQWSAFVLYGHWK